MRAKALLSPVQLGPFVLRNRMVMPALTRNRAARGGLATPLMAVYYAQRASAGLIVSEGVPISPEAVAYPALPGLWTREQVTAWRKVTDAVHARGGVIFAQLWHVGRVSHTSVQEDGRLPVAPSAVAVGEGKIFTPDGLAEFEVPRALETEEIPRVVEDYATAARNALLAGFDGVEIHAANGYLVDQFLNDSTNLRTDEYGGSLSNRSRFLLEVVDAVSGVWGSSRVGVRLSPSGSWMNCRDSDKEALYSHVVRELALLGLAYLHLIEPEMNGDAPVEPENAIPTSLFRTLYPGTIIVAGGHTEASGERTLAEGTADLVGYGRSFIANPDLPERFAVGAEVREAVRSLFYGGKEVGFTDYPSLVDEQRLAVVDAAVADGTLNKEAVRSSLVAGDPLQQLDSGDYYVRLRYLGISDAPPAPEGA